MEIVKIINAAICALFVICYSYQFFYIPVAMFRGRRHSGEFRLSRYAVLIAARNEEAVIGNLIESIRNQLYPSELIEIFVVADNCSDQTAAVAEAAGAVIYERQDRCHVGKGYALNYLLKRIGEDYPEGSFDGYFVFDADNLLEQDYIYEMNRVFSMGYEAVTGYRNSKNYDSNWISAGYSLWFLRQSQFLDRARDTLGVSCNISGTGFLLSHKLLEKCGGWNWFLLTEDVEFNADIITKGVKIGYCERAMLYDEQPTDFAQSVRQRLRWSKGQLQVCHKYGAGLIKSIFGRGGFSAFDMIMSVSPAFILSVVGAFVNVLGILLSIDNGATLLETFLSLMQSLVSAYAMLLFIGTLTTVFEWRRIHAKPMKKILYIFTFPVFMLTYIPIAIAALFTRPEWKPIVHSQAKTLDDLHCGR